jgi:hypothetical protein
MSHLQKNVDSARLAYAEADRQYMVALNREIALIRGVTRQPAAEEALVEASEVAKAYSEAKYELLLDALKASGSSLLL